MPPTSGDPGTVLPGARTRRGWYELEERHAGMARGRLLVIAALAVAAAVAPLDVSGGERLAAVAACAAAAALHALLAWIPRRRPTWLLLAADLGLLVDAALILALARATGGSDSLALWLLPLFCLAVTLALGAVQGVKALVLSAIVAGAVVVWAGETESALTNAAGPLAMAAAVWAIAAGLTELNERDLQRSRRRLSVLHAASVALVRAEDADAVVGAATEGARAVLGDGWTVDVRLGDAPVTERAWRADGRAYLELPLTAPGDGDGGAEAAPARPLGAITGSRAVRGPATVQVRGRAVNALRTLARDASAALVQVELREGLERLSLLDPLTSLGNRRAFDEALATETARARRSGASMGVVILDVDHFKQFNDRHGHQAGDDALMAVARVLDREARTEDRACRIGGEEFALLLPGADDAAAAAVAERVRRAVERDASPVEALTVSLGVAASAGDDPHALVATADARLYVAKAAGRNRVIAS